MRATNAKGGESYLRSQYEAVCKERDYLQTQVEKLEKDNQELKKTVFELSYLLSQQTPVTGQIFRLDDHRPEIDRCLNCIIQLPCTHDEHSGVGSIDGTTASLGRSEQEDERYLHAEHELRGHTGAVYCVNFSRNGRWIASGSLDKSVRIWDARDPFKQIACLNEHQQLVSDVAWLDEPEESSRFAHILCSSSFDHTVRTWDFTRSQSLCTTRLESFVLCLHSAHRCAALDGEKGVFAGTINGTVALLDSRTSEVALSWSHSSGIQSICSVDDVVICTGDNEGALTWWDVRTGDAIAATAADQSHAHTRVCDVKCAKLSSNSYIDSLFAANYSDHVLRLYTLRNEEEGPNEPTAPSSPSLSPQMLHGLRGHITGNWPIRCSLFVGSRYRHTPGYQSTLNRAKSPLGPLRMEPSQARESRTYPHPRGPHPAAQASAHEDHFPLPASTNPSPPTVREWSKSFMLSTGSIDGRVYVYDLSYSKVNEARLWQVLEGHTDKVYAVAYHPTEPILASCSGDRTVRIWSPRRKSVLAEGSTA